MAKGALLDWRSRRSVGSGPLAIAVPCARVPGRYAEPRIVANRVAIPWRWSRGASDVRRLDHFRFAQRVTKHSVALSTTSRLTERERLASPFTPCSVTPHRAWSATLPV